VTDTEYAPRDDIKWRSDNSWWHGNALLPDN